MRRVESGGEALAELVGMNGVVHLAVCKVPEEKRALTRCPGRSSVASGVENAIEGLARSGANPVDHAKPIENEGIEIPGLDKCELI